VGMVLGMGMHSWEWEGMVMLQAIPAHLYIHGGSPGTKASCVLNPFQSRQQVTKEDNAEKWPKVVLVEKALRCHYQIYFNLAVKCI